MSYEVLAVRYATRQTRSSEVYLNYHTYGEPDEPIAMDYFYWVVRNGEATIIVDTGFAPPVAAARGRTVTCPVPDGLARLGVDAADVSTVVVTHAHYDHIGNLGLFPNASVVISAAEMSFWTGPMARRAHFADTVEVTDLDLLRRIDKEGRLVRISGTQEIAPGLTLIEVGGHTPGQLMVLVDAEQGAVLLTSDAVHYYDELDRDRPFLIVADLPGMYRGFDTIREMTGDSDTRLVPGHDPLVFDRFPPLDAVEPGFGVRVG